MVTRLRERPLALETAKAQVDEVQRRCNLRADWFDALSADVRTLDERVETAIVEQSAYVQVLVGNAAYTSTDADQEPRAQRIKTGETLLAVAQVIEEMITDIAGVGTTVLEEDADVGALEDQVDRYRINAEVMLKPYILADDEAEDTLFFSIGRGGVTEATESILARRCRVDSRRGVDTRTVRNGLLWGN